MNKTFKRVMAYVCVPLFLSIVGIVIVYFCLSPYIKSAGSTISLLTTDGETVVGDENTDLVPEDYNTEETKETQPESIPYSPDMQPKLGDGYARLICERLNMNERVGYGDRSDELDIGVGQYIGSSIFGFGKPILVAGHHETSFYPFQYIEIGDVFKVVTSYGEYTYTVYDTKVADANDKSATLLDAGREVLVMYTCYPFTPLTSYSQRLFVYANKTSGPDLIY